MRRLTQVLDNDLFPISYAEAAKRLEITVQALRNKLVRYRKQHDADTVRLSDLTQPYPAAHNPLFDHVGRRISYTDAAKDLNIPRVELYRLVGLLRVRNPDVRNGAALTMALLETHVSEEGDINIDGEYV